MPEFYVRPGAQAESTLRQGPPSDAKPLEIIVDREGLPVSVLSSLLRAVQAALREVARDSNDTRHAFSQQPQPVLHVSTFVSDGDLVLRFAFVDGLNSASLPHLSAQCFAAFMEQFARTNG
jgi:hypothetical protein